MPEDMQHSARRHAAPACPRKRLRALRTCAVFPVARLRQPSVETRAARFRALFDKNGGLRTATLA